MSDSAGHSQIFEALIPATFAAVYHHAAELLIGAADTCCALAGAHLGTSGGLHGRRTVHVGAGFGADTRRACLWGVADALGLEAGPEGVALANVIETSSDEDLARLFARDDIAAALYAPAVIERSIAEILAERIQIRNLPFPVHVDVRHCDVTAGAILDAIDGSPRDAMIGNFMLHWLPAKTQSLAQALERLAPAVREGGVAVFSVPFPFVEPAGDAAEDSYRTATAFATPLYRRAIELLLPRLSSEGAPQVLGYPTSKMPPALRIRDVEAESGSPMFRFLARQTQFLPVRHGTLVNSLRGYLLYDAILRTGWPARRLVNIVARTFDDACRSVHPLELERPTGLFVRYYVYRRQ